MTLLFFSKTNKIRKLIDYNGMKNISFTTSNFKGLTWNLTNILKSLGGEIECDEYGYDYEGNKCDGKCNLIIASKFHDDITV